GWTLSDVPFYGTELPQYALLELLRGLEADVVHLAAALSYTLLVVLAAAVARGAATGVEAAVRVGVAVAVLLVPSPGNGFHTVLSSPNHTGTAVPLLVTWLVLDRAEGRRPAWLFPSLVGLLLAWGQPGDP